MMYQSRLLLSNGIISLALDALNGEMLALVRESTDDNVLKNHIRRTWSLLDGLLLTDSGPVRFHVPRYPDIRSDPTLTPVLRVTEEDHGGTAVLTYPALVASSGRLDLEAEITVRLLPDDCRTCWKLVLHNRTGFELEDVAFPSLDGVWLGEQYEDDILVYPHFSGCRLDNPTAQLASSPKCIHWKWQEYIREYNLTQACGTEDERGAFVLRLNYSGKASMLWMDLYDPAEKTGLYLTCRSTGLAMKALRMESFGDSDPGVGLAILHRPGIKNGTWTSEECILALHEGDWHWAADEYRTWRTGSEERSLKRNIPKWFEESPGLVAHYDFQYQGGGIVHTFQDIPRLMQEAQALGFHHLLLAGWHEDGFDYGFPHYTPNHLLGTQQKLKEAVQRCHSMGGHVSFYVNSRLCNTAFADQQKRIRDSAVMQSDGRPMTEKYGAADFSFASMCMSDPSWRHFLFETVRYLTHEIDGDGIYLDQLAMADSLKCYHPDHREHAGNPCAWNRGCRKLLEELQPLLASEGKVLIYEGCSDAYGPYAGCQLISELHCPFQGRMPEVYRYTFPDQLLIDMMNPRRHSAMRPEHIARHSTELLLRAFTMDASFWCYDLEWDHTFRRDPEQYQFLQSLAALQRSRLTRYGHGTFTDTVGLGPVPSGILAGRFLLPNGILVACASEPSLQGTLLIEWNREQPPVCEIMTSHAPVPVCAEYGLQEDGGRRFIRFQLPHAQAAVLVFRNP